MTQIPWSTNYFLLLVKQLPHYKYEYLVLRGTLKTYMKRIPGLRTTIYASRKIFSHVGFEPTVQ